MLRVRETERGLRAKRASWTEENETLGTGGRQLVRRSHRRLNRLTMRPRSHPAVKRQGGGAHPTLDLDGEVEMQGGDKREAEHQPNTR